jgi:hypothetical protein
LKRKHPGISEAKIEAGIFAGPQLKQLIKDNVFYIAPNDSE